MTNPQQDSKPTQSSTVEDEIDKIIFRCFEQGHYWGELTMADQEGISPDREKPKEPIDRTQALAQIKALLQAHTSHLLDTLLEAIGEDESFIYDNDTSPESKHVIEIDARNELRQEIRAKFTTIIKEMQK